MPHKYQTFRDSPTIKKIEILSETDTHVIFNIDVYARDGGQPFQAKELKRSTNECYFDTFEEAKKRLLIMAALRITKCRRELQNAKTFIEKVRKLEEKN